MIRMTRLLKVARAPQGGAVRFSNVSFAYHDAARVHLSLLPFTGLALLTLRLDSGAGWPSLTVHCAELADFLAVTYQICPPEDEARIVADELATPGSSIAALASRPVSIGWSAS